MNWLQKQNYLRSITLQQQPDSVRRDAWNDECLHRRSTRYDQWHTSAAIVQQGDVN